MPRDSVPVRLTKPAAVWVGDDVYSPAPQGNGSLHTLNDHPAERTDGLYMPNGTFYLFRMRPPMGFA